MKSQFLPLTDAFFRILYGKYETNRRTFYVDGLKSERESYSEIQSSDYKWPYVIFHGNLTGSNAIQLEERPHPDLKYVLPKIFFHDAVQNQNPDELVTFSAEFSPQEPPQLVSKDTIVRFSYNKQSGEPHMEVINADSNQIPKLSYIYFSNDSEYFFKSIDDPNSQPSVCIRSDCGNTIAVFFQPKDISGNQEAINYITHARNQCIIYFLYYQIPIVIKTPNARMEPNYFQNVWQSAFLQYPNSIDLLNPDIPIYFMLTIKTLKKFYDLKMLVNNNFPKIRGKSPGEMPKDQSPRQNHYEQLPINLISKTVPYFPDTDVVQRENIKISKDSAFLIYPRFSEYVMSISQIRNFEITNKTYQKNVICFVELGYTTMNLNSKLTFKPEKNILNTSTSVYNTIMHIAGKCTQRLFFNSEPGVVQFVEDRDPALLAFYTRNRQSIMANANAIAAALRTANIVIIPITLSHVSLFLESFKCAMTNWIRFALSYPIVGKDLTTVFFVFPETECQSEEEFQPIEFLLRNAFAAHIDNPDLEIKIVTSITPKDLEDLKIEIDTKKILLSDIKYSVAAFATVNDCAEFLHLNDPQEENYPNSIFD